MGDIRQGDRWGETLGSLDSDGTVFEGRSGHWGRTLGRVDFEGAVFSGSGWGEREVGSVDREGRIWRGMGFWKVEIGRVDRDGCVLTDPGWNTPVGWVEGPLTHAAGAALLWLLR